MCTPFGTFKVCIVSTFGVLERTLLTEHCRLLATQLNVSTQISRNINIFYLSIFTFFLLSNTICGQSKP